MLSLYWSQSNIFLKYKFDNIIPYALNSLMISNLTKNKTNSSAWPYRCYMSLCNPLGPHLGSLIILWPFLFQFNHLNLPVRLPSQSHHFFSACAWEALFLFFAWQAPFNSSILFLMSSFQRCLPWEPCLSAPATLYHIAVLISLTALSESKIILFIICLLHLKLKRYKSGHDLFSALGR